MSQMTKRQSLDDLATRLRKAADDLNPETTTNRYRSRAEGMERARLSGKAEGVRLALSYVQEYLR